MASNSDFVIFLPATVINTGSVEVWAFEMKAQLNKAANITFSFLNFIVIL
jgi:hypothetical protein